MFKARLMTARKLNVKTIAPEVEAMLQCDGMYLAGDSQNPKFVIPVMSMGGKLYALVKGQEINPLQFLPTATLSGPFVPNASR